MIWVPHQLIGVPVTFNVTLECLVEAFPTSLNYWTRQNDQMIHESGKFKSETIIGSPNYKAIMRLTITNVQEEDYGTYKCIAKNPRGETDSGIRLYRKFFFFITELISGEIKLNVLLFLLLIVLLTPFHFYI